MVIKKTREEFLKKVIILLGTSIIFFFSLTMLFGLFDKPITVVTQNCPCGDGYGSGCQDCYSVNLCDDGHTKIPSVFVYDKDKDIWCEVNVKNG